MSVFVSKYYLNNVDLFKIGSLRWNKWGPFPDFFHGANSTDCLSLSSSWMVFSPPEYEFLSSDSPSL